MTISTVRSRTHAETHTHFVLQAFGGMIQLYSRWPQLLSTLYMVDRLAKMERNESIAQSLFSTYSSFNRMAAIELILVIVLICELATKYTVVMVTYTMACVQLDLTLGLLTSTLVDANPLMITSPTFPVQYSKIPGKKWKKWKPSCFNDLTGKERYVRQIKLCFTSPFQGCFSRSQHNSRKHQKDIRRGNKR